LSGKLQELGFLPSKIDTVVFFYNHGNHKIFVLMYVDDIIVNISSIDVVDALIRDHKDFSLKDLGSLRYFLGIEVTRSKSSLLLTQARYAADVLKRAHMSNCKSVSSPLTPFDKLMINDGVALGPRDPTEYRSIVGGLQYLTLTRSDLSYSVNKVCQFSHSQDCALGGC
jgi:hypothetical protein